MDTKKKICVIVGVILAIAGIVAINYAQNEINSSWGYTWTQPYSDFESKILTIKNIGIGALVIGILDDIVVGFSVLFKSDCAGEEKESED